MGIENIRKVGSDCFRLYKSNIFNTSLEYHLEQFNIDDYYIFKSSRYYIQVNIKDFLDFKYAGYIFFKKDKYNLDYILNWIDYLHNKKLETNYFNKPFPPIEVMNKIKIIDKIWK